MIWTGYDNPRISKYHIIRFHDDLTEDKRIGGDYFLVTINPYGNMSVELILYEEMDSIGILENLDKIAFHNIYYPNASEIMIAENAKIIVIKEELHINIIFEAEDQKWYILQESDPSEKKYFSGTLKLLLFSAYSNSRVGLYGKERTFPPYFQATLDYKLLCNEEDYNTDEYRAAYNKYIHLSRYTHTTPFRGSAESFDSVANKYKKGNTRI